MSEGGPQLVHDGVPGYLTSKTHTRLGSLMYSGPATNSSPLNGINSFLHNKFNETTRINEDMPMIAEVIGSKNLANKGKHIMLGTNIRPTFGSKKPSNKQAQPISRNKPGIYEHDFTAYDHENDRNLLNLKK
jgi:hypothetical protein